MANPFPFASGEVLTAANLNEIGGWDDFTPTWQNVTVGNGTLTARYTEVNGIVFASGSLVFGSTTAITGNMYVSTPVDAADKERLAAGTLAQFFDSSANRIYLGSGRANAVGTVRLFTHDTSGADVFLTALSGTSPFTWATGDELVWAQTYEAA